MPKKIVISIFLIVGVYLTTDCQDNSTAAEEDTGMMMAPFVEPTTATWQGFKDLAQTVQTETALFTDAEYDMTIYADYTESATEFFFESYVNGTYTGNVTEGSSIIFVDYTNVESHFQMSYNILTGVMNGIQVEGSVSGTANSTAISMSYHIQTELDGFNLPAYQWGGAGWTFPFPGFGLYAAIAAIGSLFLVAVIIRKRK